MDVKYITLLRGGGWTASVDVSLLVMDVIHATREWMRVCNKQWEDFVNPEFIAKIRRTDLKEYRYHVSFVPRTRLNSTLLDESRCDWIALRFGRGKFNLGGLQYAALHIDRAAEVNVELPSRFEMVLTTGKLCQGNQQCMRIVGHKL